MNLNEEKDKNVETSDFNEAQLQIYRLNNLSDEYSRCWTGDEGKYQKAIWITDQIHIELYADIQELDKNKPESETHELKLKILNKIIFKQTSYAGKYIAIQNKRKYLKIIQELVGKGSKKSKPQRRIM